MHFVSQKNYVKMDLMLITKCIRCKLDWQPWHTSVHSGRPTVPRELDESHHDDLHISRQSAPRSSPHLRLMGHSPFAPYLATLVAQPPCVFCYSSTRSLSPALGVFWDTTGPQMHSLQARLEKLAHVRSFGTFNSSARARRVAPRTSPH